MTVKDGVTDIIGGVGVMNKVLTARLPIKTGGIAFRF